MQKEEKNKLDDFTLKEHLFELKFRLIKIVIFFIIATLATLQFAWDIFALLSEPLKKLTANDPSFHFIYTKLTEGFVTEIKISFVVALFLTSPVFFFQLYKFLAPGLYKNEKRVLMPYLFFPPILFFMGMLLVYFVVMPITWKFFLSFQNLSSSVPIRLEAKVSEYVDLIVDLFISFGIAFQLPILLVMLVKLKIITTHQLIKSRRYSVVLIFVIAAVLTPPDVFSQIILALPLMLLYEISIFCCKRVKLR
jgi:sec-independent protein translocase protein TatC